MFTAAFLVVPLGVSPPGRIPISANKAKFSAYLGQMSTTLSLAILVPWRERISEPRRVGPAGPGGVEAGEEEEEEEEEEEKEEKEEEKEEEEEETGQRTEMTAMSKVVGQEANHWPGFPAIYFCFGDLQMGSSSVKHDGKANQNRCFFSVYVLCAVLSCTKDKKRGTGGSVCGGSP